VVGLPIIAGKPTSSKYCKLILLLQDGPFANILDLLFYQPLHQNH